MNRIQFVFQFFWNYRTKLNHSNELVKRRYKNRLRLPVNTIYLNAVGLVAPVMQRSITGVIIVIATIRFYSKVEAENFFNRSVYRQSQNYVSRVSWDWMGSMCDRCERTTVKELAEILQLRAEPDFRAVKLHWEYPKNGANFHGFQIHYCELQAWGSNRCRTKIIDESAGTESVTGKKFRMYSVIINSLRMATNYSFEVRPLEVRHNSQYTKNYGKSIVVPTKGFSAKASLCLPDISEVEVSTGPYFGGRIAVESSDGTKTDNCSIGGDINSAKDTYVLRIEHKTCGSTVNRTTVSTFVLVQETLPILTHSTRRFVVLCTFQPETLTVRAGINLPYNAFFNNPSATSAVPLRNEISLANEILGNDVQPASLMQVSEAENYARNFRNETEPHYVLISALIMTSIIGVILTVWWMIPLKKSISLSGKSSTLSIFSNDSSTSSAYENYTNSIKDNSSITEIDFGEMLGEKYFNENCYPSEVFNPNIGEFCTKNEFTTPNHILNMPTEQQSQSEA